MSLKGIIEVAIHTESFRNVDLFHQGLYHLRFSVSCGQATSKVSGHPYMIMNSQVPKVKKSQKQDPHHIIPASKDESSQSISSSAFLIRYCEEEVELNEISCFRIELDERVEMEKNELKIEAELVFSELEGEVTVEKAYEMTSSSQLEFKSVAKSTLIIYNAFSGIHEYFPLVFNENYFSIVNLMVHVSLLDFRYRVLPLTALGKQVKNKPAYNSFAEYLFRDSRGKPKTFVGAEETDKVYKDYIEKLLGSFESMKNAFVLIAGKCLTSKEKISFSQLCTIPRLTIPGFSGQLKKNYLDSLNDSGLGCIEENEEHPELSLSSISGIEDERQNSSFRFSERVASHDPCKIATLLLTDINLIAGSLFQLWHRLLELVKLVPRPLNTLLQEMHHDKVKERLSENIIRVVHRTKDFSIAHEENLGEMHETLANCKRNDRAFQMRSLMPIEEEVITNGIDLRPILFEDVCIREKNSMGNSVQPVSTSTDESIENDNSISFKLSRLYKGVHLIVLVHGFQGNHFDMRLMKNNIALIHPEALFLCSNSNEESTEGDISEMGVRLAQEVMNFISEWCPNRSLGRLSFIGHSMGGLIIRAALPYLENYSSKMHMYISLSSPHLGYMYNSSKIIDAGMWFLKKWRKSKCLQQLSMSENPSLRQCFLYELSTKKGLGWFKHIMLVSSYQDQYAPYDSARMELTLKSGNEPEKAEIYEEMTRNLLAGMNVEALYRLDINFRMPEKSLDTLIGRAAHIQFLENQTLMKMIIHRYPELFS
jgi:pimeloyl-ACP methyl ester carboxylesterase